ncbi:tRNA-specific 2-thiouridylase MnmA [Polystyrenella longa]|uniref:tRNA-specific 2-thiouridylase MnmA n=1 Tax=Polystyrenella longa TaxID=2528007 RepID=A0A518CUH1_9PLAN|nr:tRNA 2-thiouridine(34) synthase MnmA [Polystyrenella longa]QDU82880.1 tRNA-specific 2-thiouridylase MnmA [Polystyrenella longa]
MSTRVVLAMSGGVDSSAAAHLLQQQGYEVIGLFMRSGVAAEEACALPIDNPLPVLNSKSHKQGCCSASDAADARRVADKLDIPFHALNFQDAFGRIKDYFADEYLAGRTPNPCVMCNIWLKFGKLWDFASSVGAEKIATGHYARLVPDETTGTISLRRGTDRKKDQTYVLFGINPDLLDKIIFPVCDFEKSDLREMARQAGINTHDKKDSQEICFIPDQDYVGFIQRYRGDFDTSGELVDTAGNVVGQHAGFQNFTIGQRKGLGVTFGEPRFVVEINPDTKQVVLGTREDLGRHELEADQMNVLVPNLPDRFRCQAMIRYQHTPADCDVELLGDDRFRVQFDNPQYGVAPGQACVLYDDDRVLGGGWIC